MVRKKKKKTKVESPEIDDGIDRNPESFSKTIRRDRVSFISYTTALFESLRKNNREFLIPHMSIERRLKLYKVYIKTRLSPKKRKIARTELRRLKRRTKKLIKPLPIKRKRIRKTKIKAKKRITKEHFRKGKKIKESTSNVLPWTEAEIRFINSRKKNKSNKDLAGEINDFFGTNRSVTSVRDRKLRLRGKKK